MLPEGLPRSASEPNYQSWARVRPQQVIDTILPLINNLAWIQPPGQAADSSGEVYQMVEDRTLSSPQDEPNKETAILDPSGADLAVFCAAARRTTANAEGTMDCLGLILAFLMDRLEAKLKCDPHGVTHCFTVKNELYGYMFKFSDVTQNREVELDITNDRPEYQGCGSVLCAIELVARRAMPQYDGTPHGRRICSTCSGFPSQGITAGKKRARTRNRSHVVTLIPFLCIGSEPSRSDLDDQGDRGSEESNRQITEALKQPLCRVTPTRFKAEQGMFRIRELWRDPNFQDADEHGHDLIAELAALTCAPPGMIYEPITLDQNGYVILENAFMILSGAWDRYENAPPENIEPEYNPVRSWNFGDETARWADEDSPEYQLQRYFYDPTYNPGGNTPMVHRPAWDQFEELTRPEDAGPPPYEEKPPPYPLEGL